MRVRKVVGSFGSICSGIHLERDKKNEKRVFQVPEFVVSQEIVMSTVIMYAVID